MDTQEPSPYAPPATSDARIDAKAPLEPTLAELRATVGPKADYYLAQWRRSPGPGANWAAFFVAPLWMVFRGMYLAAVILVVASVLVGALEEVVFGWLGHAEVPRVFDRLTSLALGIYCSFM